MGGLRWPVLAVCVATAVGAQLQQGVALLDLAPPVAAEHTGPQARFVSELTHVHEQFSNISTVLDGVEGEQATTTALANAAADMPDAMRTLASSIATLRRVRADVAGASNAELPAPVRMQVAWDIDRCGSHPRGGASRPASSDCQPRPSACAARARPSLT